MNATPPAQAAGPTARRNGAGGIIRSADHRQSSIIASKPRPFSLLFFYFSFVAHSSGSNAHVPFGSFLHNRFFLSHSQPPPATTASTVVQSCRRISIYLSINLPAPLHTSPTPALASPRHRLSLSLYLSLSLALCCVHGGAAAVQRDVPAVGLVRAGVGRQQELLGGDQAGGGGRRRGRGAGGGAQPLHRARARRVQGHGARAARARPAVAARRRLRLLQALRRRRQGQEQGRRQRQSQGQAAPLTDLVRTTSGSAFGYRRRSIGTEFGSFRMLFQIKATVTISSFDGRFIKITRKKAQKFRTQRHFDPTRKLE
jgi:hypothetical protein